MRRLRAAAALAAIALCACARRTPAPSSAAGAGTFGAERGRPDSSQWLGRDSRRARSAGAQDSQVIAVEAGTTGDRVSGLLRVPEQECALLIARAAESVEDVDLFIYGDDGTVLGTDEGSDKTPTLLVCPPHPRRLFVVARIAAGQGLVAVGAQRVSSRDAGKVGQALSARGRPGEAARRLGTWPALDEVLAEHRRELGLRWQEVGRVATPVDPHLPAHVSAAVDADRCLDVLALPSEEVSQLELAVLDLQGRIVGRAKSVGRERSIVLCARTKTPVTIELRPHGGRGIAALLLSRTLDGDTDALRQNTLTVDLTPIGDLDDSREKNQRWLEQAGYAQAKVLEHGSLSVGRRASLELDLPRGCARLDVLGGRPLNGLEAWLWGPDGSLLATDKSGARATLFACSKGGRARLDAEALLRPGHFAVELRRERETPPLLEQNPLAAGRLLSNVILRGLVRNASEIGAPSLVTLSPTRIAAQPLTVPIGRCVDVTLALGDGMMGAELRLLDSTNGEELAYQRGTYTANARACALHRGQTLNARAELRSGAGAGTGLVATRLVTPHE